MAAKPDPSTPPGTALGEQTLDMLKGGLTWLGLRPEGMGGGGTPTYWLYGYVPLERIWFSSHLLWDIV